MTTTIIRLRTVKLLGKVMRPLAEENLLSMPELREILAQLRHLAEKGQTMPPVEPRLIDQAEVATMLGISLAQMRKFDREGRLPFKRRMIGTSVRFRNLDVLAFLMGSEEISLNTEEETESTNELSTASPQLTITIGKQEKPQNE
jgi:predicted DNA-binding transcriptional regulator AlpA